ncbi:DUF3482 domain-containing protein [Aldersonia sp. NBC_00410]|uniref:hypothetical protein n=1 Tax=Aldersonia sp. NBC_00410 TaxID=2975954 RepID=UPI002257E592|nr:hypothetical protein [Aldersonia sp. NBC_00410]MCX5045816.1 DUF3482 domain-containing protein [Aldersonia sp. NBC_00410]
MKLSKLTVTAVLAAGAVAVAAGTANAAPVASPPAAAVASPAYVGTDHGIGYRTYLSQAGRAITTTVDAGTFRLVGDRVTLTDPSGVLIAEVPLGYEIAGQRMSVEPLISNAGRTLSVLPGVGATDAALQNIDAQQWFYNELNRAAPGAAIGALIGAGIGLFFLGVGVIPGAAIGALIGLIAVGGQPLVDSAFAFLAPR